MPAGLPVAIALLAAQAAVTPNKPSAAAPSTPAPAAVPAPPGKPTNVATAETCTPGRPSAATHEIVICAPRPEGYRIDPDILKAKRLKKSGGRPTRPGPGAIKDTSRCVVGPEGCPSYGINLIGAALTAAEMASRLEKGEEIGSMFVTDPQPDEYQLYLYAKHEREADEAAKAAKKAKAAKAPQPAPAPSDSATTPARR